MAYLCFIDYLSFCGEHKVSKLETVDFNVSLLLLTADCEENLKSVVYGIFLSFGHLHNAFP